MADEKKSLFERYVLLVPAMAAVAALFLKQRYIALALIALRICVVGDERHALGNWEDSAQTLCSAREVNGLHSYD